MKIVMIIADGAADYPVPELGDKTPLEVAYIPNVAFLAQRGRTGLINNVFEDLPVDSIVAAMGLLGYTPYQYFPNGRASFEAIAGGVYLRPQDIAFRCNLISLEGRRIKDFTAGLIEDTVAHNIVMGSTPSNPRIEIFPNQSYRNILVYRDACVPASSFQCSPPHQHRQELIDDLWIQAKTDDPQAIKIAEELNEFQRESMEQIKNLNNVYGSEADMFWLWSPSDAPRLPSFQSRYGLRGAVIGGLNFLKGIGIAAQMLAPWVPGANGYIDTNWKGKFEEAVRLLQFVDFLLLHLNAPDEEAHQHNVGGKIRAIELIDEHIVGPLARHLREHYPNEHRLAFLPDHYTCVADGKHVVRSVPYFVYGSGIEQDAASHFSEKECEAQCEQPIKAWELLPYLINL